MIPKDLSPMDMLSFQTDEGKIFFNHHRAILMEADALGTLRKDLISALGMDRAKGFLLRYGWNCAYNYAKQISRTYTWKEELGWFHAGVKLHGLTGNVLAVPVEIRADPENGSFYAEGFWYNSYEAEQHIRHFGYHHEPVCSTLIGWAGGFTTHGFGRKVIYKEVECVGKGDPHCRWIGKTLEDWGAEISSELPFYEEENLAIELDRAYRRIEKQKEELQSVLRMNEKLTHVLIQGGGLSAIVKVLGHCIRTAVILEDNHFHLLEFFGDYESHNIAGFIQAPAGRDTGRIRRLIVEKRTTHLTIPEQFGWPHQRLICPIVLKNEVCGYLSLVKPPGHVFDEMDMISLERTALICALQFLNERTAIETEQRVKGEFLNELLMENPDVEKLSYRMKLMGYDLDKSHFVFVFNLQGSGKSQTPNQQSFLMDFRKRLEDAIHNLLITYGRSFFVSSRIDKVIALIPEEMIRETKLDPKSFGVLLMNRVSANYSDFKITLGISSQCKGIHAFRNGYHEAEKAIGMARTGKMKSDVILFEELGTLGKILLHAKDEHELEKFAMGMLKDLVNYDRKNGGELLRTLYHYFQEQGNIHRTARAMMISIGAVRYRLRRIHEICGLDLSQSRDFYNTHLAIQILIYYGIFEIQ
jgi:sugar diacid utilization regulator